MDNTFEKAKSVYGTGAYDDATLEFLFPQLKESEDERLRKLLVWQVHRNIEDETNDLAGSVYDGIKGHDPDLEESIEDWKKCLAWLEKQKEQKPAEWSEKHIAGVFEKVGLAKIVREQGNDTLTNAVQSAMIELSKVENTGWSEEDEKIVNNIVSVLGQYIDYKAVSGTGSGYATPRYAKEIDWLKSLRPQKFDASKLENFDPVDVLNRIKREWPMAWEKVVWKPSDEQMEALKRTVNKHAKTDVADSVRLAIMYDNLKKLM